MAFVTFVTRASECLQPSKTQEFERSVALDLPRHQWLMPMLLAIKRRATHPDQRFWNLEYADVHRAFADALAGVGASSLKSTLYCCRHGGASHDFSMGDRCLLGIQQRGGWKSFKSVMCYQKHGRLGMELQKLSAAKLCHIRQLAASAETSCARSCAFR